MSGSSGPSEPAASAGRRRRRAAWIAAGGLVVLGLAAHLLYAYAPRERAALPRPGELPARLLAEPGFSDALWIPYPHQNLGALGDAAGDREEFLAALARRAGLPDPVLPAFGPFAIPPARELGFAVDREDGRFLLAARIYRGLALVARLAGRLAGNPWLAGGTAMADGRPVRVTWEGSLWTVAGGVPGGAAASPGRLPLDLPRKPVLAVARMAPGFSPLPAGVYLLERSGDDLVAGTLVAAPEIGGEPEELGGTPFLAARRGEEGAEALALFAAEGGAGGLPGAALLRRGGGGGESDGGWRLPGEGWLGLLGAGLESARVGGWRVVALDRESLERGAALVPILERRLGSGEDGDPLAFGGDRLAFGLWLDLAAARRVLDRVADALERIPVVGERQARPWRDGEILLRPLSGYDRLSIAVGSAPPGAAIRLRKGPAGSGESPR